MKPLKKNTPSRLLELDDSRVVSELPEASGRITEARFLVRAHEVGSRAVKEYMLSAMTQEAYSAWFMERDVEGELLEGEVWPLVVPDDYVGREGLVAAVQHLYLDPTQPDRINHIAKNLDGPFDATESN